MDFRNKQRLGLLQRLERICKHQRRGYSFIPFLYRLRTGLLKPAGRRYPLRNKAGNISCSPFFIIGSGRSGNTLLRAILSVHPSVGIPPEFYRFYQSSLVYRIHSNCDWPELCHRTLEVVFSSKDFDTWQVSQNAILEELRALPEAQRGLDRIFDILYQHYLRTRGPSKNIWGDKTPWNTHHLWRIHEIFPNARFIHILRDGRDVVSSYLRAGLYESPEMAVARWVQSSRRARQFGARIGKENFLEIKYEDLVTQPQETVHAICSFLGLSFQPAMLTNYQQLYTDLGDTQRHEHHRNVQHAISKASVGKWRQSLTKEQQAVVLPSVIPYLEEYGYETD